MSEFYPTDKVNLDPSYWEELYKEALLDAKALLKMKRNVAACFHCHAAIEKALKCLLATKNELDPKNDDTHSLKKLASKAGLFDILSPEGIALFKELSDLHNEASYPAVMLKYRAINEDGYTEMVVRGTANAIIVIEGLLGEERENNCER